MKPDAPKYRCPFTVDWVRNQADIEIHQLMLFDVPRQERLTVVFDISSDTVAHEATSQVDDSPSR